MKGDSMKESITREIVGISEELEPGATYWVTHFRDSSVGEYVELDHVSRRGIATVRVSSCLPVSGQTRHDLPVNSLVWYRDIIV